MNRYHIIFVSIMDENIASHRFRVLKLIPYIKSKDIEVSMLHYHPRFELFAIPRLISKIVRYYNRKTIVVFQKTIAYKMAGISKLLNAKIVMDIDDGSFEKIDGSTYNNGVINNFIKWTKLMDAVVVSCKEMDQWINGWNNNVYIIPTCVDVEYYKNINKNKQEKCIIGWVGNGAKTLLNPIESEISEAIRKNSSEFLVIGDRDPEFNDSLNYKFIPWKLELEPSIFGMFDIGINPLPDNERARMKAGFKLIQYMAAGLPVIASPVGLNKQIVQHGVNGFLVNKKEEWIEYLDLLIKNPELRSKMGKAGQNYVSENYNITVAANLWKNVCNSLI